MFSILHSEPEHEYCVVRIVVNNYFVYSGMSEFSTSLDRVFESFDCCSRCEREKNPLRHILGGGLKERPRFLFLFINPTHHNISSHADYRGTRRYPFLGVRYFWKVMAEAGVLDTTVVKDIYERGWQVEHERIIEEQLCERKIYSTNLVKCTQPHPENPSREAITEDFPLLQREIELVNPRYVVAFGKMPTRALTGVDVRLRDYLAAVRSKTYQPIPACATNMPYAVLPCYFPVGRGNPPKAVEVLTYILKNF